MNHLQPLRSQDKTFSVISLVCASWGRLTSSLAQPKPLPIDRVRAGPRLPSSCVSVRPGGHLELHDPAPWSGWILRPPATCCRRCPAPRARRQHRLAGIQRQFMSTHNPPPPPTGFSVVRHPLYIKRFLESSPSSVRLSLCFRSSHLFIQPFSVSHCSVSASGSTTFLSYHTDPGGCLPSFD